jgi:hypothetical protein
VNAQCTSEADIVVNAFVLANSLQLTAIGFTIQLAANSYQLYYSACSKVAAGFHIQR